MHKEEILDSLKSVIDPELGINIVDLGLVYNVDINGNDVFVTMTMTSQACPMGDLLKRQVIDNIRANFPGSGNVEAALTVDPPWTNEMMSDAAKKQLGV